MDFVCRLNNLPFIIVILLCSHLSDHPSVSLPLLDPVVMELGGKAPVSHFMERQRHAEVQ